jgi:hypothetical protein
MTWSSNSRRRVPTQGSATRLRERLDLDMTAKVLRKAQSLAIAQLEAPRTRDRLGHRVAGTVATMMLLARSVISLVA